MTESGGSGAGKSFYYVLPNGMKGNTSMILTDPKAELLHKLGNILQLQGYRVVSFNLIDPDKSDGYNPFDYIRSDNDVIKLVTNIMQNTTPKGSSASDPFWDNATSLFLQAIMSYVWYECPKQGKNASVREMMELLNKARVNEKEGDKSELDQMMEALPSDHPARIAYVKVVSGAKDTIRSIIISTHARLAYLQNPKILRILDHDDINIRAIGEGLYCNPERKTALFCVIPDNDKSYNFLVGLLYTQIFQELYYIADFEYDGALPIHVAFWMDEFANTALPDGFTEILSTMRSRNISCNIILQNRAQLQALFKDAWQSILGNCDVLIYLGGNEAETHKSMTEMLGKYTIEKKSTGESKGAHGSSSSNYDVLGRELLMTDEVRKMDNKKCLLFIRGCDPVIDDKYHTPEKSEFSVLTKLGLYQGSRETEQSERDEQVSFYIDGEGENALEHSCCYQLENYHGIFHESKVFQMMEHVGDEYLRVPQELGGYGIRYNQGCVEVYPAYSLAKAKMINAGGRRMTLYPVIGYYECGSLIEREQEDLYRLFQKKNRMSPVKKEIVFDV